VSASLSSVPIPRDGIEFAELEGESVLYDHEKMAMVYLNESASVVWRLCDGHRTVADIIDAIAQAFPDQANEVSLDVPETIEFFAQQGVLQLGEA
jgi:coenzyme PQQ biosynthesis protein PqqD